MKFSMKAAEIRSLFLNYFKKNGHTLVESSSLIPQNDPSLLFTNAGMVQFKDVFLGKESRSYKRATSSQKCVRAGGKHNDLENVGFTARHHTFFEMLGNFSFGDYFKKEAIHFAWEFVTQELKLPQNKLYVTVYEKDDEAAEIWNKQERVAHDRIFRFGEKDNFWSMGDTGPCGPCSEIFIDRGEKYSCGKATCGMGCDCDRFMEFWNLVFMQFDRDAEGKLIPLPKPSVDTGAGLERIASIIQNVDTNYDTDLFQEIIRKTGELAKKTYDRNSELAVSFRVIADHARATTFLIADGVLPSNEGRGYVLRRIMRRAIRHGRKLGLNEPFFYQTAQFVIEQMKMAYPQLIEKKALIEKVALAEEEQFLKTLERGLVLLDEEAGKLSSGETLPGQIAFKLYDTYGFPLDLTRVICSEKHIKIDESGFEVCMDRQRTESRKHWKGSGEEKLNTLYLDIFQELKTKNQLPQFVGYTETVSQSPCVAILAPNSDSLEKVNFVTTPPLSMTADSTEKAPIVEAIFSETPFYGESGGQVGDQGRILRDHEFEGEVIDVQKPLSELIVVHIRLKKGTLQVGETYRQETHREIRALTARNHTATHLLHWALREVLGDHVKQAGSLVSPELLRFDFSHFNPMTESQLSQVEDLVNQKIWHSSVVKKQEMKKEEALAAGAIAFFGEKYGEQVRVVSVGEFSTELCGGTHVDNANEIHLFKIANESGIAAGVRRIVAYTSKGAFDYLRSRDHELKEVRDRLKVSSSDEILGKIDKMALTERELKKQIELFQAKSASHEVDLLLSESLTLGGAIIVTAECAADSQGIKRLRDLSDRIKQKQPNTVIVLGMKDPESSKASLLVALGPEAPKAIHANELIQKISPLIEGRGGGKPDLAQAGGTNATGLSKALEQAKVWLQQKLPH